jgi:hypothetical protein
VRVLDIMTDMKCSEDPRKLYAKQLLRLNEYHKSRPRIARITRGDMATTVTVDQYGNPSTASGYGSSEHSEHSRSPLSMSLGFLKTLTEKKSTRGEGFKPLPLHIS